MMDGYLAEAMPTDFLQSHGDVLAYNLQETARCGVSPWAVQANFDLYTGP